MEVKDCFVIMPFSTSPSHSEDEWTEIFEKFFNPAWNKFKIGCYRTKVPRGSITKDIIEKLYSASVVFADLTDSNPNVLYELGVRHSFKKPSVMVKAKGSKIPFDVNDYNVFEYEYTPKGLEDLENHINTVIQDIKKYPNKSDNSVGDFLQASDFIVDYYKNIEVIQKLESLREELKSNLERCNEFLEGIKDIKIPKDDKDAETFEFNEDEGRKLQRRMEAFFPIIRNDAIIHLKITRYINFTDEDWDILNKIDDFYRWCYFYSTNLGAYILDETEKQEINEIREIIREGVNIINRRISELKMK